MRTLVDPLVEVAIFFSAAAVLFTFISWVITRFVKREGKR